MFKRWDKSFIHRISIWKTSCLIKQIEIEILAENTFLHVLNSWGLVALPQVSKHPI